MGLEKKSDIAKGAAMRLRLFREWLTSKVLNFKAWGRGLQNLWQPVKDVIKDKHRFVVIDNQTLKEKFSFQLSGINIFVTVGVTVIVLVVLTALLIAFTPLRELIPGYANTEMVEQTYRNARVIDSLEQELSNQEWMVQTIKDVMMGKEIPGEEAYAKQEPSTKAGPVSYTHSKADSLLRVEVEEQDSKYQVKSKSAAAQSVAGDPSDARASSASSMQATTLNTQLLFTPLKGKVISPYNAAIHHYGVDVAGSTNATINAVYSGTVIFANFTVETGYVIAIQHPGNVISVYKHNSQLLKKDGDVVRTGEPIAYLGNSGELTTGPHLHFELWMGGKPVDPKQYISF